MQSLPKIYIRDIFYITFSVSKVFEVPGYLALIAHLNSHQLRFRGAMAVHASSNHVMQYRSTYQVLTLHDFPINHCWANSKLENSHVWARLLVEQAQGSFVLSPLCFNGLLCSIKIHQSPSNMGPSVCLCPWRCVQRVTLGIAVQSRYSEAGPRGEAELPKFLSEIRSDVEGIPVSADFWIVSCAVLRCNPGIPQRMSALCLDFLMESKLNVV